MIEVENVSTWGFEHAVRGMRNPMDSWDKSDSDFQWVDILKMEWVIGPNDLSLMKKLFKAGTTHRKYLRQIFVSLDITAPLYWWKEFDTYKVGTVSNSCSTMHKIHSKPFSLEDFSCEHLNKDSLEVLKCVIRILNGYREDFVNADCKTKDDWWQMIQLLPSSYNQRRTITLTYENIANILETRSSHKLDEWRKLCDIFRELPYVKEIMEEE